MTEEKYVQSFDGARIYYHVNRGTKNTWLIFLHGLGGDLTAWQKERRYFDVLGLSTVALDLRGHGLSARSEKEGFYDLSNFVKDIEALIKAEKMQDVILVGHCFGGMISIMFGAIYPELHKGMVLMDTGYRPPVFAKKLADHKLLHRVLGWVAEYGPDVKVAGHESAPSMESSDLSFHRLFSDVLHTSLRSYLLMCESLMNYDATKLLEKLKKPTLVIDGVLDTFFPPNVATALKNRIKHAELDLIEGANHILVTNNPKDVNTAIHSFLKKIKIVD